MELTLYGPNGGINFFGTSESIFVRRDFENLFAEFLKIFIKILRSIKENSKYLQILYMDVTEIIKTF